MNERIYSTGEQWIAKRDLLRKIINEPEYERASAFMDGFAHAWAEAEVERDHLRQTCTKLHDAAPDLAEALKRLLLAYESLLPGLAKIAVQDYQIINDAPFEAHQALKKAGVEVER